MRDVYYKEWVKGIPGVPATATTPAIPYTAGYHTWVKIPAIFHQWAQGFEDHEGYPVAIIELPDGSVRSVPLYHINFKAPQ